MMMAVMTTVMVRRSLSRNGRTGKDNKCHNGKQNIADLHWEMLLRCSDSWEND